MFTTSLILLLCYILEFNRRYASLPIPLRRRHHVFNQSAEFGITLKDTCPSSHHFDTILLIVAFGATSEIESIPLFELLYKSSFKHRLYCGPDAWSNKSTDSFSFLTVNTRHGAFLYDCMSEALRMHRNYSGYLFLGEDILLNYWNMLNLDMTRIWEGKGTKPGPDLYGQVYDNKVFEWWPSPWGMQAVEKLYEYFVELNYYDNRKQKLTDGRWMPTWDVLQALNTWLWNGGGKYRTYWTEQSLVYLPAKFMNVYLNITKHARSSGIRQGIAHPLIIRMLQLKSSIISLKTGTVNSNTRQEIMDNREKLKELSMDYKVIHLKGTRKQRREILNHLTLKEYAVGKFLQYSSCH